ncbi:uncharacterized protein LOC135817431 [Sycon ciliatum]|uniref:uncharacterized protein LOC135817431 n=1 Tax=Sycon ciliatum TaxID=27933 RepID=UPI0031F69C17
MAAFTIAVLGLALIGEMVSCQGPGHEDHVCQTNATTKVRLSDAMPRTPGNFSLHIEYPGVPILDLCTHSNCTLLLRVCLGPSLGNISLHRAKGFMRWCRVGATPLVRQLEINVTKSEMINLDHIRIDLPVIFQGRKKKVRFFLAVFDISEYKAQQSLQPRTGDGTSGKLLRLQIMSPPISPVLGGGSGFAGVGEGHDHSCLRACCTAGATVNDKECRCFVYGRGKLSHCLHYRWKYSGQALNTAPSQNSNSSPMPTGKNTIASQSCLFTNFAQKIARPINLRNMKPQFEQRLNCTIYCAVPGVWSEWMPWTQHPLASTWMVRTRRCFKVPADEYSPLKVLDRVEPVVQCNGSPVQFQDKDRPEKKFVPEQSWQCEGHAGAIPDNRDWLDLSVCRISRRVCVSSYVEENPIDDVALLNSSKAAEFGLPNCTVGEVEGCNMESKCENQRSKQLPHGGGTRRPTVAPSGGVKPVIFISCGIVGFVCLAGLLILAICLYRRQQHRHAELAGAQERLLDNVKSLSRTLSTPQAQPPATAPPRKGILSRGKTTRFGSEFYSSSSPPSGRSTKVDSQWTQRRKKASFISSEDVDLSTEYQPGDTLLTVAGCLAAPQPSHGQPAGKTLPPGLAKQSTADEHGNGTSTDGVIAESPGNSRSLSAGRPGNQRELPLQGYSAYSPPGIAAKASLRVPPATRPVEDKDIGGGSGDSGNDLLSPLVCRSALTLTPTHANPKSVSADHGLYHEHGKRRKPGAAAVEKQFVCSESAISKQHAQKAGKRSPREDLYAHVMESQRHSSAALRQSNIIMM